MNSYHFVLSLSSTHLPARFAAVSSSGVSLLLVSPPWPQAYRLQAPSTAPQKQIAFFSYFTPYLKHTTPAPFCQALLPLFPNISRYYFSIFRYFCVMAVSFLHCKKPTCKKQTTDIFYIYSKYKKYFWFSKTDILNLIIIKIFSKKRLYCKEKRYFEAR